MSNPNQLDWRFFTVGDITVAAPTDLDLADAEIARAPDETDADFEAAKATYGALFKVLK